HHRGEHQERDDHPSCTHWQVLQVARHNRTLSESNCLSESDGPCACDRSMSGIQTIDRLAASTPVYRAGVGFSARYPGEVDEAALNVGVNELHAYPIADIKTLEAAHDFPLRRWPEDADPRTLLGRARHNCIERLSYLRCKKERRRRLPHLPLHLGHVILLLGAVARQFIELIDGV